MKCDELKAFEVGLGQMLEDGGPVVIAVDENNNPRLLKEEKVYLKSEADKVIAENDAEIKELKERATLLECDAQNEHNAAVAVRMENLKLKHLLRKQKRKRCLAMARACHLMLSVRLFPDKEYFRK